MSPHDDGIAITELMKFPRTKCGEVFTWNNTELYAVECLLCDDKNLCTLMEFAKHMQVRHRCGVSADEDDATKSTKASLEKQKIEQNVLTKTESVEEKLHNSNEIIAQEIVVRNKDVDAETTLKESNVNNDAQPEVDKKHEVINRERIGNLELDENKVDEKKAAPCSTLLSNKSQMQQQVTVGQELCVLFEDVLIESNTEKCKTDEIFNNEKPEGSLNNKETLENECDKINATVETCGLQRFTGLTLLDKEITSDQILLLINLFKCHPRLWNPSHEEFSKTDVCLESWQEIVSNFNTVSQKTFKINDLKKGISILCQRYRDEKLRLKDKESWNSNNTDEIFPYSEALRFLDDQPDAIQSRRNIMYEQNCKVIEIYKRFPILWNTADKVKASPNEQTEALESISKALGRCDVHLSSTSVQRRLHALRKCYHKEKLKYLNCLSENRTFRTHFKHYGQMQFLQQHIAPFKCTLCIKIFEKLDELTEHMENHGQKKEQEENDSFQQTVMHQENTDLEAKNVEELNSNEKLCTEEKQAEDKNADQTSQTNKEKNSCSVITTDRLKEQQEASSMEVDKFLATLLNREPLLEVATSIFRDGNGTREEVVQRRDELKPSVESIDFSADFNNAMNEIFNKTIENVGSPSTKATNTLCNAYEVGAYEIATATSPLNESQKPEKPEQNISSNTPEDSISPRSNQNISNSTQEISSSPTNESNTRIILDCNQQNANLQQPDSNDHLFLNSTQVNSSLQSENMNTQNSLNVMLQISTFPDQIFNEQHTLNSAEMISNSSLKSSVQLLNYTEQISNWSPSVNCNPENIGTYTQQTENSAQHVLNDLYNLNSTRQTLTPPSNIFNTPDILNSVQQMNPLENINNVQQSSSQQPLNAQCVLKSTQDVVNSHGQTLITQPILNSIQEVTNSGINGENKLNTIKHDVNSNRIIFNTQPKATISEQTLNLASGASQSSQQILNADPLLNVSSPHNFIFTQQILNAPESVLNNSQENLLNTQHIINPPQQASESSQITMNVCHLPTISPTYDLDNTGYSINSSENTIDQAGDNLNIPYIYFNDHETTGTMSISQNFINTQEYSMASLLINPKDNNICQIILSAEDLQNNATQFPHNIISAGEPVNIIQGVSGNMSQHILNIEHNDTNFPSKSFETMNLGNNVPPQNVEFSQNNFRIFQFEDKNQEATQYLISDSCNSINSAQYVANNIRMCISSPSDVSNFTESTSTDVASEPITNELNSIKALLTNKVDVQNETAIVTSSKKQTIKRNCEVDIKNISKKPKKNCTLLTNHSGEDSKTFVGSSQDSGAHSKVLTTENCNDSSDSAPLLPVINPTRLTGEQTHKLIAIYKENPSLWNPNHSDFNCRIGRQVAWQSITATINELCNLRMHWQTVYKKLTDFVKYYRKEKERVANDGVNSKWYYFQDFQFLDQYLDITSDSHKTMQEKELNMKIIKIYETYPQLWNTHLQEYKRRSQRGRHIDDMLRSLQEEANVQVPIEKLKRKLLEFRCNYRQEKEKRIECAKNNEAFESFYEYYKPLSFLEDHISPFTCKVCGETFQRLTEIWRHYRATKHQKISKKRINLRGNANAENEIKNVCHICGAKFTLRNNLVYHLNRHLGKRTHMCNMCPKSFYNSTALRVHERSHTKEYPYVCEQCGQAFVNNSKLNQHRKRHSNNRDFVCTDCGKAFFTAFERDKHAKRHLKIRDQICPICGKGFIVGSSIYTHMELHSEVKKYVCKICDKRFSQNSGLYRHKKTHQK